MVARDGVEPPTVAFFRAALYRMPRTHLLLLPGVKIAAQNLEKRDPKVDNALGLPLGPDTCVFWNWPTLSHG
jgi:hypothetical protein